MQYILMFPFCKNFSPLFNNSQANFTLMWEFFNEKHRKIFEIFNEKNENKQKSHDRFINGY